MTPLFSSLLSLSLGGHEEGIFSVGTLELYLDPHVLACPFEPFSQSMDQVTTMELFFVAVVVEVVVSGSLSIVDVMIAAEFCYVECSEPMVGNCRPVRLS